MKLWFLFFYEVILVPYLPYRNYDSCFAWERNFGTKIMIPVLLDKIILALKLWFLFCLIKEFGPGHEVMIHVLFRISALKFVFLFYLIKKFWHRNFDSWFAWWRNFGTEIMIPYCFVWCMNLVALILRYPFSFCLGYLLDEGIIALKLWSLFCLMKMECFCFVLSKLWIRIHTTGDIPTSTYL